MSTDQPIRTIAGFGTPRPTTGVHVDASRLVARNRVATPTADAPSAPASSGGAAVVAAAKVQLNAAVPSDLRARARTTYRATAHLEGHRSFSDFVATAIETEIHRLEQLHNAGQPFTGPDQPLPTGRPLGG